MPALFTATAPEWQLEVFGPKPDLPPFIDVNTASTIGFSGVDVVANALRAVGGTLERIDSTTRLEPLFFEECEYDFYLLTKDPEVSLKLPDFAVEKKVTAEFQHYSMRFGSFAGFFAVEISGKNGVTRIQFEVFPRKVNYRSDYAALRSEVSALLRNLAMAANSQVFGLAAPDPSHLPTMNEWFAILSHYFNGFRQIAQRICDQPETVLRKSAELVRTDRARRVGRSEFARAMRSGGGGPVVPHVNVSLSQRIHQTRPRLSVDTPENRFVKSVLLATHRLLGELLVVDTSGDEDAESNVEKRYFEGIRPSVRGMRRTIAKLLASSAMMAVSRSAVVRPHSMLLVRHPVYGAFDRFARLFNGGLAFLDPKIAIGVKSTHLLYEYWCFLKLVALLRSSQLELEAQSIIKTENLRMTIVLTKGVASTITLVHKRSGEKVNVTYNRLFNRLPTVAQQPDNVIQFSNADRFFILDAKYRLQFDEDYQQRNGGIGPRTDDINTMHRYRDAIIIPHPQQPGRYTHGLVRGAIVLFPYPNEVAYVSHRFFQSIAKVDVGGLPFLPGATKLVAEKLALLVNDFTSANQALP